MKLVKSQGYVLSKMPSNVVMGQIEVAGRLCYKSENLITDESASKFIKGIISRGHESVIEHIQVSALIICDRSISHQIVRHRIGSYSQESQRYCNYNKDKFDKEVRFIIPTWLEKEEDELKEFIEHGHTKNLSVPGEIWVRSMQMAEKNYKNLIEPFGWTPEQARTVLPNSTKTEIYMSMNLRQWRHFLKIRTEKSADPQIRKIALELLSDFKSYLPEIFEDIPYNNPECNIQGQPL